MNPLTAVQARVLASLIEKKETTPDQYPLTIKALRTACNQKTSRDPVTHYTEGEVGHALRELESLGLVREEWGARAPRWGHEAGKVWNLHSPGLALIATLMLRGPQTLGELRTHAHRLHEFDDLDDVQYALGKLEERDPPMVTPLPRQPGQKEGRYAHLLCGEPKLPAAPPREPTGRTPVAARTTGEDGIAGRLEALENAVEALQARLERLESAAGSSDSGS